VKFRAFGEGAVTRLWRNNERGGTKLKTLLVLAILFAMVFSIVKVVPIYVLNYEFQDSMQEEATYASVNRKTADQIRTDLGKKLQSLGLAADANDIQVTANEGNVTISLEYTVPVNLAVYQLQLHFHPHADNASL
jgi:predicted membrane protein